MRILVSAFVLVATLAFGWGAQASVIYDFIITARTGPFTPSSDLNIRLTFTDEAAAAGVINFKQDPGAPVADPILHFPAITTGSGAEQFGWGPDSARLPGTSNFDHFAANLSVLPDGLAGTISSDDESDNLRLSGSGNSWSGVMFADWAPRCGTPTACTFEGYFARVPEPTSTVLFGAALLGLIAFRRKVWKA